jgi:hypothetical protein
VDAIRSRIKRDSIGHVREGGRVYVVLGDDQGTTSTDQGGDQGSARLSAQAALVEGLRDQVTYMRRQLAEEREARRRADTILAQLSAANAEQARTIRAIEGDSTIVERPGEAPPEASPQESRYAPQSAAEEPEGTGHPEHQRRTAGARRAPLMAASVLLRGMTS